MLNCDIFKDYFVEDKASLSMAWTSALVRMIIKSPFRRMVVMKLGEHVYVTVYSLQPPVVGT